MSLLITGYIVRSRNLVMSIAMRCLFGTSMNTSSVCVWNGKDNEWSELLASIGCESWLKTVDSCGFPMWISLLFHERASLLGRIDRPFCASIGSLSTQYSPSLNSIIKTLFIRQFCQILNDIAKVTRFAFPKRLVARRSWLKMIPLRCWSNFSNHQLLLFYRWPADGAPRILRVFKFVHLQRGDNLAGIV